LLSRGNDYTATNGTTITLTTATVAGDIIEVFANQTIPLTDTYSQTVSDGRFIKNTLTTTTGDIIYASAANTPARLGIGSTGQVLTVSGGVPTWATPSSGGMTLISSSSPTGVSTVTFSSISSSYKHLLVSAKNVKIAAPNNLDLRVRFNGVTSSDYWFYSIKLTDTTVSGGQATLQTAMRFGDLTANGTNNYRNLFGEFWVYEYNIAHNPTITGTMTAANNANNQHFATFRGLLDSQQAITSITLFDNGGNNFTGGTFYLYGVA
jgi:hypothetical protein